LKKIVREEPDYSHPRWNKVSAEAMDLVKKLLTKEKEHRIVIEKVLEHPWILHGDTNLLSRRKNSQDYIEKFKAMSLTN